MTHQNDSSSRLPTLRELRQGIDQMVLSADGKATLMRLAETTTVVGDRLIEIGRRIVAFVLNLVRQFPNIAFCVLTAMVISALITSIPLLGPLLGMLISPLLLAAGVAGGAALELSDGGLRERIDLLVTQFEQILA